MPAKKERHLLEAVLTNIEVAADAAMASDLVASIPVIGTAFKVCKALDDIRSRAFAAKLDAFVSSPDLAAPSVKAAMQRLAKSSPSEAQKIGETLFLVLDRYIDLDKPLILAKVFAAYLGASITAKELQRLAQAIDLAFASDLVDLMAADAHIVEGHWDGVQYPWMETLIPSGLTVSTARGVGVVRPFVEVTLLGRTFWKAARHAPGSDA
jgi:hypothetical protein